MERVSTDMSNNDMQYWMKIREYKLSQLENQMSSQQRIQNLRDDPIGASHAVRYQSDLARLSRYAKNVNTVIDTNNVADGYLATATSIMQRVRHLAVQGANGTYTKGDLQNMGEEVNQLLNELIQLANSRSPDGTALFAGTANQGSAFRTLSGNVPGASGSVVTEVGYTGNITENRVQTGDVSSISANIPGDRIFWAEQQQVFSNVDATSYVVQRNSTIAIDGHAIRLRAGDNIYAIISKINNSGAEVRAHLDPVKSSLVLETTTPHQFWLRDVSGAPVLQQLGILGSVDTNPPHNLASSAQVSGGSLFDMVIRLRNDLYQGKTVNIGGSALKGIDAGLNNLLSARAQFGSINERLKQVGNTIAYEIPLVTQDLSRETDVNMATAIMNLRKLQLTQQAAFETAARILQPTLLNYLR